jgi:hypothetical protein
MDVPKDQGPIPKGANKVVLGQVHMEAPHMTRSAEKGGCALDFFKSGFFIPYVMIFLWIFNLFGGI